MKLKYYLRGIGIGIIVTTIILMIAYSGQKNELTDAEIIARAEALGMVMKEDPLFSNSSLNNNETESEIVTESESEVEEQTESEKEDADMDSEVSSEDTLETDVETETETELIAEKPEMYHLVIPAGTMPRAICNELEENGVIESASKLREYLRDVGFATLIPVGEYDIPYGATDEEIYQILKEGPL